MTEEEQDANMHIDDAAKNSKSLLTDEHGRLICSQCKSLFFLECGTFSILLTCLDMMVIAEVLLALHVEVFQSE